MLLDSIDGAWSVGNMVFSATKATTTQLSMDQVDAMSHQQIIDNCRAAGGPYGFAQNYGILEQSPFSVNYSGPRVPQYYYTHGCTLLADSL